MDAIAPGAEHVASAAALVGATSVYLSCAEVFDGLADAPYVESDDPRPATPFGAAKLAAERAVARTNPHHLIVRSSWVFGAGAPNFVERLIDAGRAAERCRGRRGDALQPHVRRAPRRRDGRARAPARLRRVPPLGGRELHAPAARAGALRSLALDAQAVATTDGTLSASGPADLVLASRRPEAPRLPDWRLGLTAYLDARARPRPAVTTAGTT